MILYSSVGEEKKIESKKEPISSRNEAIRVEIIPEIKSKRINLGSSFSNLSDLYTFIKRKIAGIIAASMRIVCGNSRILNILPPILSYCKIIKIY